MRKTTVLLALLVWATAGIATAELSAKYKDWIEGPAGFLATKDEKKEFSKLKTDAEAQKFIDLFWAKRNPDLNSPVNTFKLDFEQRVEAADKLFGTEKLRGSLTDRGRTLLLLGKPTHMSDLPPGSVVQGTGLGDTGSGAYQDRGALAIWEYREDRLPKTIKANQVFFIFVERRIGTNDYVLDRSDRRNAIGMKLIAEAPELLLLHPKLTEVPELGLLPNSKAATSEQLAVFSQEPRPWPEGGEAIAREGIQSETVHPLWVFLRFPDSVPPASRAVGRVRPTDGGPEVGTFAVDVTPLSVEGGRGYEFSFPLQAGSWDLDLALMGASGPIAVTTIQGKTEAVPAEGTYISPFYWGVDVRQESQAHLGDPFNIGGWHIIPRPGNDYTSAETLSYFAFVLRPGTDAEGKTKAELSLTLYLGDKKLTEVPPQPTNLSHIAGDMWMLGSGLPLAGFRKPGEYRLDVTLHDTVTDVSRTVQMPIIIQASAPAPAAAPTAPPAQP